MALISGEISTSTYVDIPKVVRETIKNIGYTRAKYGYDYQTMAVLTAIDEQSPDIAQGVDKALQYRNDISEEEIEAMEGESATEEPEVAGEDKEDKEDEENKDEE